MSTTPIKLSTRQIAYIAEHGPWPFTVDMMKVAWPDHTDDDIERKYAGKGGVPAMIVGLLSNAQKLAKQANTSSSGT